LGINRFRRFIEDALVEARFGDRVSFLAKQKAHKSPLHTLLSNDPFWSQDVLFSTEPGELSQGPSLPHLTFFSGRDGYSSTNLSLSVPLEVIGSGNAIAWTLQTLTHEISHTVIGLVLARLLPSSDDVAAVKAAADNTVDGAGPQNLFEQFRAYLCHAMMVMDLAGTKQLPVTASVLSRVLRERTAHVNEILTHTFDYLYFYRKDPDAYVRSVWASWAVIPNIQSRVPEYIVRCLCALFATNLQRINRAEITVDQLTNHLEKASSEFPAAEYIREALGSLVADRATYIAKLDQRAALVRFARHVLYSAELERRLTADILATAEGGAYSLTPGQFDETSIRSPLAFVETFSRDEKGDEKRAAWLLYKLAFSDSKP
jgi:hypothetical protein